MVVIKISYPQYNNSNISGSNNINPSHHRFTTNHNNHFYNHSLTSSTSVSPTLTDTSSEPLPSLLQVSADGDTLATSKQGKSHQNYF